ncbi:MAG: hypothetical protein HRT66_02455 [Flavobacteriaceae bacterium]|nr:hypothetical protein [Flavobacteriaceae bacterium]
MFKLKESKSILSKVNLLLVLLVVGQLFTSCDDSAEDIVEEVTEYNLNATFEANTTIDIEATFDVSNLNDLASAYGLIANVEGEGGSVVNLFTVATTKAGLVEAGATEVEGDISENTTWEGNIVLSGVVIVKDGITLTIESGTVVYANTEDTDIDILVIAQGGKLMAEGTSDNPIIFTSINAENNSLAAVDVTNAEAWGGIVINGKSTINSGDTGVGEYEATGAYGGTDEADSSGSLKYIVLKYPGFSFKEDKQLNGFSLYAVGSETTLENLIVYRGFDDGFEFFGGTANLKNSTAMYVVDDAFDWTEGWRGNGTNLIAILGDMSDKGIEGDNNGDDHEATPFSNPTITNMYIGGEGTDKKGINVRVGSKGTFSKIYLEDLKTGIDIDDMQTAKNFVEGNLTFDNIMMENITKPFDADGIVLK